jgi:hypothetical protein
MIAGDDEQAMAEAAAAATTPALTADDDPEVVRYFEKYGGKDKEPLDEEASDEAFNRILELENQAASTRQLANEFDQAADKMMANFNNKNGDMSKEDLDKLKTYANAGGYRSAAYHNSPPDVKAQIDRFESRVGGVNLMQVGGVISAGLTEGDKGSTRNLYQAEIKRSRTMARILKQRAQKAQDQADGLTTKFFGSSQPSPTSTESE